MKKMLSVMGLALLLAACGDAYESKTLRDLASMPKNSDEARKIQNEMAEKMSTEDREYISSTLMDCVMSNFKKAECNMPLSQLIKERTAREKAESEQYASMTIVDIYSIFAGKDKEKQDKLDEYFAKNVTKEDLRYMQDIAMPCAKNPSGDAKCTMPLSKLLKEIKK